MRTFEYDVMFEDDDEILSSTTDAALALRYAIRRAEQMANTGVAMSVLIRIRVIEDA